MKKTLTLFLILLSFNSFSQSLTITGFVQDTSAKVPLSNAVAMAVRMKDSVLVTFARTDKNGFFKLAGLPIDTYQVIISHPRFGDKYFYVLGSKENNTVDFGKFYLPPKSVSLKEVVIYAHKDPVYYNGDTLVYAADSFKTKANATVEDLLKKLPGIRVDAQGKITANGKAVDQVLVDGDEFFGSDPTVATRNLNASNVQSVQIYDKPKDNSTADGNTDPQKIMNLKLKEDAKRGYFGKLSGAGDFNQFYEGEAFFNKFQGSQKISIFGLASNTPNNSIQFSDAYKYGMNDQMNFQTDENGNSYYYGGNQRLTEGIPKTYKTGIYYSNRLGKNTKLTANYAYTYGQIEKQTETNSQYFFADTSYSTHNQSSSIQKNQKHAVNVDLAQTIDSLTDLYVGAKFSYMPGSDQSQSVTQFITRSDSLSRTTSTLNSNQGDALSFNSRVNLRKRFKKKDRLLDVTLFYALTGNNSLGLLQSQDYYYNSVIPNDNINQKKKISNSNYTYNGSVEYTEPLSKKLKLELSYDFNYNTINQNKQTFDFLNGEYSRLDSLYSNKFQSNRISNRGALAFIYHHKKNSLTVGSSVRTVELDNTNLFTGQRINETVNNILPYLYYSYSFSDSKRMGFRYYTTSAQPSINQLQPVPDNTNPNYVVLGNPSLLPNYKHDLSVYYYSYRAITGSNVGAEFHFIPTLNDFSNSIVYDSIGRTITQPINVKGNYTSRMYFYANIPFFSRLLEVGPNLGINFSDNSNYINNVENTTRNTGANASLDVGIKTDPVNFTVGADYRYNIPSSTISSSANEPYSTQVYSSNLILDLPKKFSLRTDAEYTIDQRRSIGYNLKYFIWNASLNKTFFKKENLIFSVEVFDLLNQNINIRRTVQDNVITDTKSNIVGRYGLLKAVYKFNSNKQKAKPENEDY